MELTILVVASLVHFIASQATTSQYDSSYCFASNSAGEIITYIADQLNNCWYWECISIGNVVRLVERPCPTGTAVSNFYSLGAVYPCTEEYDADVVKYDCTRQSVSPVIQPPCYQEYINSGTCKNGGIVVVQSDVCVCDCTGTGYTDWDCSKAGEITILDPGGGPTAAATTTTTSAPAAATTTTSTPAAATTTKNSTAIDATVTSCPPEVPNSQTVIQVNAGIYQIECNPGYWTPDKSYVQTVNCTNNNWESTILPCVGIECQLPQTTEQSSLNFTLQPVGNPTVGTNVTYRCNSEVYELVGGSQTSTCTSSGEWSSSAPICNLIADGLGTNDNNTTSRVQLTGAIVGGCMAAAVVIATIVIVLCLVKRNKRRKESITAGENIAPKTDIRKRDFNEEISSRYEDDNDYYSTIAADSIADVFVIDDYYNPARRGSRTSGYEIARKDSVAHTYGAAVTESQTTTNLENSDSVPAISDPMKTEAVQLQSSSPEADLNSHRNEIEAMYLNDKKTVELLPATPSRDSVLYNVVDSSRSVALNLQLPDHPTDISLGEEEDLTVYEGPTCRQVPEDYIECI